MTDQNHISGESTTPAAETRTCSKCGRELRLTAYNFSVHAASPGGFRLRCKRCYNEAEAARRRRATRGEPRRAGHPTKAEVALQAEADKLAAIPEPERERYAEADQPEREQIEAFVALDALILETFSVAPRSFDLSTRDGRLDAARFRLEMAPSGFVAEAAANLRQHVAAADEFVHELRAYRIDLDMLLGALTDQREAPETSSQVG